MTFKLIRAGALRCASLFLTLCVAITAVQAKTKTVTSVSASAPSSTFGQPIMLAASVNPQGATGKITFYDGANILGSASLLNGAASLTTIAIRYGNRSITARYGGDSNYDASLSVVLALTVITKPGGGLAQATGVNVDAYGVQPAVLADLNHDGNLDLVGTGPQSNIDSQATIWIFLGKGDGTFQSPQTYLPGVSSLSVAVADIDMDGNPDLIVMGSDGLATLIGNGDGTFKTGTTIAPPDGRIVRIADINNDGKADLLILHNSPPAVEIFLGNGDGTFQTNSPAKVTLASAPDDLQVADLNGDGFPDLAAVSRESDSVTVLLGTAEGKFGSPAVYTSYGAASLAVADLNGDGKPDIVVGNIGLPSFDLLLGNGDGTFAPARTVSTTVGPLPDGAGAGSFVISVYDFDGDGHPDVVSTDGNSQVGVMLGNGDGTFRMPYLFPLFASNGALLVGDLNHDGIPDIVTNGSPSPIQPYLGKLAPVFTLAASPNPANAGQDYTLTATSSYADATGEITFQNSGGTLGKATLAAGVATYTVSRPSNGVLYLGGTYSGDSKYSATVLPLLYLVVQQSVGLTLSASPNPAVPGQPITLSATVSMDVGNAKVAFFDGVTLLGEQTSNPRTATFTTTLPAGIHQLSATFPEYFGFIATPATATEIVQAASGGVLIAGPTSATDSTSGATIADDLNGDGLLDIAELDTGNQSVNIYLGNGKGAFQTPRQNALAFVPGAIVAAQFNIYGLTDLAITDPADNKIALLLYYSDGFYFPLFGGDGPIPATIPVGKQPVAIATADFNGDGFADLVTANAGSNDVSVLNTVGQPGVLRRAVSIPAGKHPHAVVTGDFNNDGKADFAVANRDDNTVMVFAGNGDGTFQNPIVTSAGSGPIALVAGDLNGDGKTDLIALNGGSNQVTILLGNGDGTFTVSAGHSTGAKGSSLALVDLNGDNKLDLAVTTTAGLSIFLSNGDGTFSGPVNYPQYSGAVSVSAGAFSGTGRMDLVLSLPSTQSLALVVNGTPTTTSLSVSPTISHMSGKVTLKATVSPDNTVGPISFYDGVTQIGASPVSKGSGAFSTNLLFPGKHSLSARFGGGSGYGPSTSSAVDLEVSPVTATGLSAPIRQSFPSNEPVNLIPGDFNKDGIQDFAFWRNGNGLVVILGNGDGTFHYPPAGTSTAIGGASPVTADFNNDGNTDIASFGSSLALGDGKGGFNDFGEQFNYPASSVIAAADFNGDGRTDLVFGSSTGAAVVLGIGNGTFQRARDFPAGMNPVVIAAGDFNEDGKPDVVAATPSSTSDSSAAGSLNFLAGNGDGTFGPPRSFSIPAQPLAMVVADFNADGHTDVALAHSGSNTASILLGKGDGTFAPAVTYTLGAIPAQMLSADMDGDGHPDLVVMFTSAAPAFAVLYGKGDGTFGTPVNYPDLVAPAAIAIGDVNRDGRMDVILAESDTVNVFPGAVGSLSLIKGSAQVAAVGTPFPVALSVGAPSGTQVTFTAPIAAGSSGSGGSFPGGAAAVTVTADSSGVATAPVFTANTKPGSYIVIASARGAAGILSFSLTNKPGPPATVEALQGGGQSVVVNNPFPLPLAAEAVDQYGNGVPGASVTFAAPATGASLTFPGGGSTAVEVTNPNGIVISPFPTANSVPGSFSVSASIPGLASDASFALTNQPPPTITAVSGGSQSAILNASFSAPLLAKVSDGSGKPVAFIQVTFTAPESGASAMFAGNGSNTLSTITDQQGLASSLKLSAAGATGSYSVIASLPLSGGSVAFPLSNISNPPGQLQPQSISFPPIPRHAASDPPFPLTASASSGLPVSFRVIFGPATISGNILTITGVGGVSVQAVQPGNTTYLPADPVNQFFFVVEPAVVIQTVENAASYRAGGLAADESVSIFGSGFATQTFSGDASESQQLGGVSVGITDNSGKETLAGLSYVSPSQVNLVVPEGVVIGPASLTVNNNARLSVPYSTSVVAVAPALFTADASGTGPPAAYVATIEPGQAAQSSAVFQCSGSPPHCATLPIDVSIPNSQFVLTLYGTGLRGNSDLSKVSVKIGGAPMSVTYSGAQPTYAGLDQVNVQLARSLAGRGQVVLELTVEGVPSNPVQLAFK